MEDKTFGFIGGGRITYIILEALKKAASFPNKVFVSDINPDSLAKIKKTFPGVITSCENNLPAQQDVVLLSIHPPVMKETLNGIKSELKTNAILISLAPKITIKQLTESLDGFNRIIRMNPNAPTIINKGFNPVCFSDAFSATEKSELINLFNILGNTPEVEEKKIEAFAVITAMGPTYLWFQLYQLISLARSFGLNEEEIKAGITSMVNGAVETMFYSELLPEDVMNLIPVKPLADVEENLKEIYIEKLNAIFNKIKSV